MMSIKPILTNTIGTTVALSSGFDDTAFMLTAEASALTSAAAQR